jgi:selenide, water dikinase
LFTTGQVHPKKIWKNSTAKQGDVIILTKKIGTGIASTAMKNNLASEKTAREATSSMITLNKYAAEILGRFPVNACTDVTGNEITDEASF